MPSSQASKGKPGKSRSRDSRSLSRATTPSAPAATSATSSATSSGPLSATTSAYLHTPLPSLLVPSALSIEALIERHSPGSTNPPSAASLHALHDDIHSRVLSHVHSRIDVCDKGMRELSRKRKDRIDEDRAREEREREDDRKKRERQKASAMATAKKREREREKEKEKEKEKEREREKEKEREDEQAREREAAFGEDEKQGEHDDALAPIRPPTVGAHGLARQDGVDLHKERSVSSPLQPADSTAHASDTAPSPSASDTSHQPPPAPVVARYETFGEDPTVFDDPTVYHIRDLTPDMTEEEKKEILCVARYPHDDLHDLTPGTPPDMDFSNAKPPNQINYSTFQAYVEPYIRPLTEEDVAFLKERGDRVTPYLMPKRGATHYRELWSKEDGTTYIDHRKFRNPNEARGSMEDMDDDKAETDHFSNPPVVARLLQLFRHEPNTAANDASTLSTDVSMTNGETTAGAHDAEGTVPTAQSNGFGDDGPVADFKPAACIPELSAASAFKLSTSARDQTSLDQRTLQELRYSGFLTPEASPDYDSYYDDEVAERLRHLQAELQYVARENGARKARVLELTEERMAMQEYSTIADDLDSQINTAYLKRNRTMSKPKKGVGKARPGQAGTGGLAVSRNAVSEGVRMLMDRRKEWKELIGPVVDFGQTTIPKDTVFDKPSMERLDKAEAEAGLEAE